MLVDSGVKPELSDRRREQKSIPSTPLVGTMFTEEINLAQRQLEYGTDEKNATYYPKVHLVEKICLLQSLQVEATRMGQPFKASTMNKGNVQPNTAMTVLGGVID
jgi:hypothetical protein